MATREQLRPMIDQGRIAKLFVPHDYPGNEEKRDLDIFINLASPGRYRRKLYFREADRWMPRSDSIFTWEELLYDSNGVETTSDQWMLQNESQ